MWIEHDDVFYNLNDFYLIRRRYSTWISLYRPQDSEDLIFNSSQKETHSMIKSSSRFSLIDLAASHAKLYKVIPTYIHFQL